MPRRYRLLTVAGVLMIAAGSAAVASASSDSREELCGRYATTRVQHSRYVVMNNVWGATTAQCVEVRSDGAFRVARSEHRNDDEAAAAYPSIYAGCHWGHCTRGANLPMRVDRLSAARSTWRIATGAPGIWNATYDLWFHTTTRDQPQPGRRRADDLAGLLGRREPQRHGRRPQRAARGGHLGHLVRGLDLELHRVRAYQSHLVRTRTSTCGPSSTTRSAAGTSARRGTSAAIEAGFEIWRDGAGLESKSFSVTTKGPAVPLPVGPAPASPAAVSATSRASTPPGRGGRRDAGLRGALEQQRVDHRSGGRRDRHQPGPPLDELGGEPGRSPRTSGWATTGVRRSHSAAATWWHVTPRTTASWVRGPA